MHRPFHPPRGNTAIKELQISQNSVDMMTDLLSNSCIGLADEDTEPTISVSLRPKPGGVKSLAIADCRSVIARELIAPAKFNLPHLSALHSAFPTKKGTVLFASLPCTEPLVHFSKIDLQNAYWSCILPKVLHQAFCFSFASKHYVLKRLPFGWDKSPKVFQDLITDILSYLSINPNTVIILIYLDDIFLASRLPGQLRLATKALCEALVQNGFLLSEMKCIFDPVLSIEWLGKTVTSTKDGIIITPSNDDILDAASLVVWCCAKYWSWPVLRQLNGLITWCTIHHRMALPFLNKSHAFIHSGSRMPDINVMHGLCEAVYFASKQSTQPLFYCIPTLPRYTPWVFWDANCVAGFAGIVVSSIDPTMPLPLLNNGYKEYTVPLPQSIAALGEKGQQLAELYSFKVAIVKSIILGLHHAFWVGDSQSTLFSALKLSCPAMMAARAKLLRQIVRLAYKHSICGQMAYIPSEYNPADNPSKPFEPRSVSSHALCLVARAQPAILSLMPMDWPLHKQHLFTC